MKRLNSDLVNVNRPATERIIQFGEGNFLRGFVDWMVQKANDKGVFSGGVVVVQPIDKGLVSSLNQQDGLYNLVLRGLVNGRKQVEQELISVVTSGLEAYQQWEEVLACAAKEEINILVSNTTEAGISYRADDSLSDAPPQSFPGKVCLYLYRRFQAFGGDCTKGMLVIPCELIDRNGDNLREIVLRLAKEWGLSVEFVQWIKDANVFVNTLVDRIVTGYPGKEEALQLWEGLGYQDHMIDTAEPYHLWVIEGPQSARERFPLEQAGLNVLWVDDLTPYRTRKVRLLNGAHTSTVALAYLSGIDYVREAVEDQVVGEFLRKVVLDEIIPTVQMDQAELEEYGLEVLQRFANPFIQHRWLDISLNSVAKFKTRVLPSLQYYLDKGEIPQLLTLSLAALIRFYRGIKQPDGNLVGDRGGETYPIRDDLSRVALISELWNQHKHDYRKLVQAVLDQQDLWGVNLADNQALVDTLANHLENLETMGVKGAILEVIG